MRVYVIMAHRVWTKCIYNPFKMYETIVERLISVAGTSPSDYFVSDLTEIQLCAEDMALTRKKTHRLQYDTFVLNDSVFCAFELKKLICTFELTL